MTSETSLKQTEEIRITANKIRVAIVNMVHSANSGHPGGALGLADIFAVLFKDVLNIKSWIQKDTERDRFLLSNGHVCAVLYASMATCGMFPEEELLTFRKLGTRLQGHPSTKALPLLENSSGSLGQGLSQACGLALGLRMQNKPSQVYIGISDGECQEGMTWEAAMSSAHYKLDNLCAFVDYNHIQIDGRIEEVMNLMDLGKKFEAFGWLIYSSDGHDIDEIQKAFAWGRKREGKPKIILFNTTLGKGVSYMENNPKWHGSPPNDEEKKQALRELSEL
jgi:transketolase